MAPFRAETLRPVSATVTVPAARAVPESEVVVPAPREARASASPMPAFCRNVRRRWVPLG